MVGNSVRGGRYDGRLSPQEREGGGHWMAIEGAWARRGRATRSKGGVPLLCRLRKSLGRIGGRERANLSATEGRTKSGSWKVAVEVSQGEGEMVKQGKEEGYLGLQIVGA